MKKWLPIILTVAMAAWFLSTLRPVPDKNFAFTEFGKLPVLASGRIQPMDSLARNSLLQIREKQEANLEPWKKPLLCPGATQQWNFSLAVPAVIHKKYDLSHFEIRPADRYAFKGRLVVQHDLGDFKGLPKFPKYLD